MKHRLPLLIALVMLAIGAVCGSQVAAAARLSPSDALAGAVRNGQRLFTTATFGGSGKTCNSCHLHGGKGPGKMPNGKRLPSLSNAAAIFPRYNAKFGRVITLEDQIHHCIANALRGKPPAYDSAAIRDLTAYVTSLAQGTPIDMGGKPR